MKMALLGRVISVLALLSIACIPSIVKCADEEEELPKGFLNEVGDTMHALLDKLLGPVEENMADAVATEDGYNALLETIESAIDDTKMDIRVVVTMGDADDHKEPNGGKVVYDTKSDRQTFADFEAGDVNEPHGDRKAISDALAEGIGFEVKCSSSTGQKEKYIAHPVPEEGNDPKLGVIRVSTKVKKGGKKCAKADDDADDDEEGED